MRSTTRARLALCRAPVAPKVHPIDRASKADLLSAEVQLAEITALLRRIERSVAPAPALSLLSGVRVNPLGSFADSL
jgi:hypothetical protein